MAIAPPTSFPHTEAGPVESLQQLYARPGFLLRRAYQISAAVFEVNCASLALTPAQYGTLTVLACAPGLDQTRLARALAFDKVTVLRVIRGLHDRGLVKRSASQDNRRQLALELTEAGWQLLQDAQSAASTAHQQLMKPLSAKEQAEFVRLLDKLNSGLAEQARAPFHPL